EDGIRDFHVTGVQTCALPIFGSLDVEGTWSRKDGREQRQHLATTDALALAAQSVTALLATRFAPETAAAAAVTEVEVRASDTPLDRTSVVRERAESEEAAVTA